MLVLRYTSIKRKTPVTLIISVSLCQQHQSVQMPEQYCDRGPKSMRQDDVKKLLAQYADVLFEKRIRKIVYCSGQWKLCFLDMESHITFVEVIPENIPPLFPVGCRPEILVLDDLIRNCSECGRILDIFTNLSYQCDVICTYLTQNLITL